MTEAAGSGPGHSAPGREPWAICPSPGAEQQYTCSHHLADGRPTPPAHPVVRVLRDGNVESALYCPTVALQRLQVKKESGF